MDYYIIKFIDIKRHILKQNFRVKSFNCYLKMSQNPLKASTDSIKSLNESGFSSTDYVDIHQSGSFASLSKAAVNVTKSPSPVVVNDTINKNNNNNNNNNNISNSNISVKKQESPSIDGSGFSMISLNNFDTDRDNDNTMNTSGNISEISSIDSGNIGVNINSIENLKHPPFQRDLSTILSEIEDHSNQDTPSIKPTINNDDRNIDNIELTESRYLDNNNESKNDRKIIHANQEYQIVSEKRLNQIKKEKELKQFLIDKDMNKDVPKCHCQGVKLYLKSVSKIVYECFNITNVKPIQPNTTKVV